MRMMIWCRTFSLALATAMGGGVYAANLLIDNGASYPAIAGNQGGNGPWVLAEVFTVSSTLPVIGVGAFDSGKDGIAGPIDVAVYNLSGSTWSQVAGTAVSFSGTTGTLGVNSNYRVVSIPQVTLSAGTYAVVAANYADGASGTEENFNSYANGGPTFLGFNGTLGASLGDGWYVHGATLAGSYADGSVIHGPYGTAQEPVFGAGTIEVPESSQFAVVAGFGLAAFAGYRRMRK